MKLGVLAISAALVFGTMASTAYAHHVKGHQTGNDGNNPGQGLAVGQDPLLLKITRESDAGAGNGGEFLLKNCAPGRKRCQKSKFDSDPGNSGKHNQSPECDYIKDCDVYRFF